MTATILDGKALATSIKKDLAARVVELKKKGITPDSEPSWLAMTQVLIHMLAANIETAKKLV